MSPTLLTDWPNPMIYSGMAFRFPAIIPYEDWVDFLLIVLPTQANALVVLTGYKAGLVAQVLPTEAGPTGALSREWLIQNWTKWIFPATPVEQVWILPIADSSQMQENSAGGGA